MGASPRREGVGGGPRHAVGRGGVPERLRGTLIYVSDTRHHRILRVAFADKATVRIAGTAAVRSERAVCGDRPSSIRRRRRSGTGRRALATLVEPGAIALATGEPLRADAGRTASGGCSSGRIRRSSPRWRDGERRTLNFPPECDRRSTGRVGEPRRPSAPAVPHPGSPSSWRCGGRGAATASHSSSRTRGAVWSMDLSRGLLTHVADGREGSGRGGDARSATFSGIGPRTDGMNRVHVRTRERPGAVVLGGVREAPVPDGYRIVDNRDAAASAVGSWSVSEASSRTRRLGVPEGPCGATRSRSRARAGDVRGLRVWTMFETRSETVPYVINSVSGRGPKDSRPWGLAGGGSPARRSASRRTARRRGVSDGSYRQAFLWTRPEGCSAGTCLAMKRGAWLRRVQRGTFVSEQHHLDFH